MKNQLQFVVPIFLIFFCGRRIKHLSIKCCLPPTHTNYVVFNVYITPLMTEKKRVNLSEKEVCRRSLLDQSMTPLGGRGFTVYLVVG